MTGLGQRTKPSVTNALRFRTFTPQLSTLNSFVWGLDLSGTMQGAGGVDGLLWVNDASTINGQPSTHFVSYDGNGNVLSLHSASDGSESARYEYGPFGEVIRATGPMAKANPFRFSTKYQDDESDLLYYGYRYYNASTGRWISRDPIGERGGPNECAFTGNNLICSVDYLGLLVKMPPIELPPIVRPPIVRPPVGPPPVTACIIVFVGTYYVTYEIASATGAHEALGNLIGELIAPPLIGGANGTHLASPLPAGSRDPVQLPLTNPGPCNKCSNGGNGCKPCPPNSSAWEVNEPGHGSSTTHWNWIEYNQLPATYVPKPGSTRKPCDCIPIRMSSPDKPEGA